MKLALIRCSCLITEEKVCETYRYAEPQKNLFNLHPFTLMQPTWISQSISKCPCIIAHPLEFFKS